VALLVLLFVWGFLVWGFVICVVLMCGVGGVWIRSLGSLMVLLLLVA